ncbi:hypothetical protein VP01_1928g3 [Puccinia sorghi]|uniref:Uncharacterized protein n=1 Tax=Puccinia sorghi TaxID=27349 RepID=A0A0L6VEC1_9BASI|nr:hypothetical protein VP01_1928g3 [Puccinia sorghi]
MKYPLYDKVENLLLFFFVSEEDSDEYIYTFLGGTPGSSRLRGDSIKSRSGKMIKRSFKRWKGGSRAYQRGMVEVGAAAAAARGVILCHATSILGSPLTIWSWLGLNHCRIQNASAHWNSAPQWRLLMKDQLQKRVVWYLAVRKLSFSLILGQASCVKSRKTIEFPIIYPLSRVVWGVDIKNFITLHCPYHPPHSRAGSSTWSRTSEDNNLDPLSQPSLPSPSAQSQSIGRKTGLNKSGTGPVMIRKYLVWMGSPLRHVTALVTEANLE